MIFAFRCARASGINRSSYIHKSVHMLGSSNISIGSNTCISEGSWLNVNHRLPGETAIVIGSNCFIGKNNFLTSGKLITIEDYVLTAVGCKIIGSSHLISNPQVPYILSGTSDVDEIKIGVNCFIGAGVTIMGNVNIGRGSVIGANSFLTIDVPPFSLAMGNPAKVHKRYSFNTQKWLPLEEITTEDESAMPGELEYRSKMKESFGKVQMPWIAAGRSMGNL